MTTRYKASDPISVFDASLLWFDKNPHEQTRYGIHGWIVLLVRDAQVYDLAHTLLDEIEKGSIEAKKSWLRDIPPSWKDRLGSLPGELDPRNTTFSIGALVQFAAKRDQKPGFLAHLIGNTTVNVQDVEPPSSTQRKAARPSRDRARKALQDIYGDVIPDQAAEPNSILLRHVSRWLKEKKLSEVSDDTILRAAGRRHN